MVPLNILQGKKKVDVVTSALDARLVVEMWQKLGPFKIQMPLNLKMKGGGKRQKGAEDGDNVDASGSIATMENITIVVKESDAATIRNVINMENADVPAMVGK